MYLAPSAALFCWLMVPLFSQQSLSEESGTCLDQLNISNLHRIRLFLVDQPGVYCAIGKFKEETRSQSMDW